jgi:hypothetical protein
LKHHTTNFLFITEEIIASCVGEPLQDKYKETKGPPGIGRILRGFLIDGAIIPSSSESPVILKPTISPYINNELVYDTYPPTLFGIVAEIRYAYGNKKPISKKRYGRELLKVYYEHNE